MTSHSRNITKKLAGQLQDQVLNLLDDLLTICPNESDILLARLFFANQIDSETLMKGFEKWVLPWKDQILKHDEKYFEENDHIFGPLESNKVTYFKEKIKDGTLDEGNKAAIWAYFEVFISLVEQYNKVK